MKALLATLAVLGVATATVTGPEPGSLSQEVQEIPDTVWVEIVPDADSVRAIPDPIVVEPGQVVSWTTDLGEWTVTFKSGIPFGEAAVGDGIRGNRGQRRGQAVRSDAAPGRYKYDIMVRVQGGRNLRADPEVVIGPGDGPGK